MPFVGQTSASTMQLDAVVDARSTRDRAAVDARVPRRRARGRRPGGGRSFAHRRACATACADRARVGDAERRGDDAGPLRTTSTAGSGSTPVFATSARMCRSLSALNATKPAPRRPAPRPAPRAATTAVDARLRHAHGDDDDATAGAAPGRPGRGKPLAVTCGCARRGSWPRVGAGVVPLRRCRRLLRPGRSAPGARPTPRRRSWNMNAAKPMAASDAEDGEDVDGRAEGRGHGSPIGTRESVLIGGCAVDSCAAMRRRSRRLRVVADRDPRSRISILRKERARSPAPFRHTTSSALRAGRVVLEVRARRPWAEDAPGLAADGVRQAVGVGVGESRVDGQ